LASTNGALKSWPVAIENRRTEWSNVPITMSSVAAQ